MNTTVKTRSFLVLTIVLSVGAMIGCSEKGPGSSGPGVDGNLVINIERSPSETMGLVQYYLLTISGPDMEPVVDTALNVQGGFIVFDVRVPLGERRLFVLEGVRGGTVNAPLVIYRGQTIAPVLPGAITTLDIVLRPVVPMMRLSPIMPVLAPGQQLELQLEVYNIQNLAAISADFNWPWELFGDNITVELSNRQSPDVSLSWGNEGSWMGLTIADTLGGTIVNEHGNGVLVNISLPPLIQVGPEGGTGAFGIFRIDTVWSYTILGGATIPDPVFYEHSEVRLLPVPDREVQFPDVALNAEVRRRTGVQAPLPIMLGDVMPLTYFSVLDLIVSDLSGIENMANLYSLNISHNPIKNIAPLAHLVGLTHLSAENAAVQDTRVLAGMTDMRYLYLSANSISDITALSGMIRLSSLELNLNQITDISPLAGLGDLNWLQLGNNMITDISALEGMPYLYRLGLHGNQITDILPLVNNAGLGVGDVVDLWNNTALPNDSVQQAHVATLRARGVTVNMVQPPGR